MSATSLAWPILPRPSSKRPPTTSIAGSRLPTASTTSHKEYASARGDKSAGETERELALHARTLVREDSHGGQSIEAVRSEHRCGHRAICAQAPLSVPTGGANLPAGTRHGRQRLYPALNVVGVLNRRQPGCRFNRHLSTVDTRLPQTRSKRVLEPACPIQIPVCAGH